MRKLVLLILPMFFFALLPAFTSAAPLRQAKFIVESTSYTVDGIAKQMDAVPFIENGRTYVPVRYLAYVLGVVKEDILWDGKARTVTLKLDNVTLKLTIGNKTLHVNGQTEQEVGS